MERHPCMLSKFPSQMSDQGTKWVMYTLGCPFSSKKKKEWQKSEEGGSLFIYLFFFFFALGKQSVAILRTLLRNIKKKKSGKLEKDQYSIEQPNLQMVPCDQHLRLAMVFNTASFMLYSYNYHLPTIIYQFFFAIDKWGI